MSLSRRSGFLVAIAAVAFFSWPFAASAEVRSETVAYKDGDVELEGYLAWDDALAGPRAGLLVVPAWKGIDDFARDRARALAGMGYVAFAADIYGKGIRPKTQEEAAAQSAIYKKDRALLRRRANAGLGVLATNPRVDAKRLGAIGYCFGGGAVLELARSGSDVKAVVSFHGFLDTPTPEDAKKIKAKVLACHGADDPWVTWDHVAAFKKEMAEAAVDWQFIAYGGAVHAFTDPNSGSDKNVGVAYDPAAARRSWAAMKALFDETLAGK